MDTHKRSATIEVLDEHERVLRVGRYGTDRDGYRDMLSAGRRFPDRLWAVERCNGVGRHLAQRLVADGEPVVDAPAKLSARARVFSTGQGRKTDATDAHSVAVVALRTPGLRRVEVDDTTVALRLLADRRDGLGVARTAMVNRLHRLLVELAPGGATKFLSAAQARALRGTVRPRDVAGRTRRQLAAELIAELAGIDKKIKPPTRSCGSWSRPPGPGCSSCTGSACPAPLGCSATSGTSPASRPGRTSRPGAAPRPLMRLPVSRPATGSPAPGPADQPGPAHYGRGAAAPRHRGPRVLPAQARRRQDQHGGHARAQAAALRRGLPPARRRPAPRPRHRAAGASESGRTGGGGYWLQRGRLEPQRRRFGEVTSRTRQHRPYPGHGNGRRPFFEAFPTPSNNAGPQPASSALCLTPARTGAHSQAGTTTPP
jgi:hypothetical protein